jgi:hypothetical protein
MFENLGNVCGFFAYICNSGPFFAFSGSFVFVNCGCCCVYWVVVDRNCYAVCCK